MIQEQIPERVADKETHQSDRSEEQISCQCTERVNGVARKKCAERCAERNAGAEESAHHIEVFSVNAYDEAHRNCEENGSNHAV